MFCTVSVIFGCGICRVRNKCIEMSKAALDCAGPNANGSNRTVCCLFYSWLSCFMSSLPVDFLLVTILDTSNPFGQIKETFDVSNGINETFFLLL